MADEADVNVKNNLNVTGPVGVVRYFLPGGNSDLDISIESGNEEMIHLVRTETYLVIEPPSEVNPAECQFIVSNEELLTWETNNDHWKVEIKPNNLPPETPTTVNIDLNGPGS
jgi:hypothetical protein